MQATVVAWGTNDLGQTTVPPGLVGAKAISAGYWHNLAVTPTRKVIAWGLSDFGQTNVPTSLSNVLAVAAGHDHSLALRTDGTVIGWGDDFFGQTDVPSDLTNAPGAAVAIAAGAFHSVALRSDGTVECWGYDFYGQADPPADLTNAIAIACGNAFSMALRSDGTVEAWGDDYYGQIEVPADLTNVVAIAAGGFHGLALKADGNVVAWGTLNANSGAIDFGQAVVPADLTNAVAIAGGFFHSLALRSDGSVEQWGDISLGQTNPPAGLARVLALAGGYGHSIALEDDTPLIVTQPFDVATNSGKPVKFTVTATGTLPLTNRWWQIKTGSNAPITAGVVTGITNGLLTSTLTISNPTNTASYFCAVSNAAGAVTSQVATVTIVFPPVITNQPQGVVTNPGSTVYFSVTAGGTQPLSYQWLFNGTDTGVGSVNPLELDNVTTNNNGNYQVIVANNYGSVTSQVATLTVGDSPAILTQPTNRSVVLSNSVTFSVGATGAQPLNYQWWFNQTNLLTDATNASYTIAPVQTTDAGGYSVVIANDFGSITSSVATLTVVLPPTIVTQPSDVATNSGKPVKFTVTATGSLPLTNRWWQIKTGSNAPITTGVVTGTTNGLLTSTLTISNPTNTASYFCVLSNAAGVLTSQVATATIGIPPSINSHPQSVITNPATTVFFSVTAGGTQPLTYQWLFNGTDTGAGSVNPLELDNVSTNNNGNYQVIVANAFGSITSQVATLTVGNSPAIINQPTNRSVALGGNASFAVTVVGAQPLSYQWWLNQTNLLTDATNSSYTVNNAQTNDAGGYSVTVANEFGSVTSSVATLTVLLPPTIVSQPSSVATNSGKTVKFTVSALGSLPLTNRWWQIKSGTNAAITTGIAAGTTNGLFTSTLTISNPTNNTSYFCIVSNSVGSVTSQVAALTIVAPPVITNQPQNVVTNPGSTVFFTVTAGGTQPLYYQWLFNGVDTGAGSVNPLELDNVTTNNSGNYQVIITNNYGAVTSQVAVLAVAYQSLSPAQLWLLFHSGNSDGIMMALEAGKNYRIQSSTNLSTWTDVTNFLSSSTLMNYTNSHPLGVDSMFYRVVSP